LVGWLVSLFVCLFLFVDAKNSVQHADINIQFAQQSQLFVSCFLARPRCPVFRTEHRASENESVSILNWDQHKRSNACIT
jgi:hypothetical protein